MMARQCIIPPARTTTPPPSVRAPRLRQIVTRVERRVSGDVEVPVIDNDAPTVRPGVA